jgi:TonB family protein
LPFIERRNTIYGMKSLRFLAVILFASCLITPAHAQATAQKAAPQPPVLKLSIDLLSDTGGVDVSPYVKSMVSDLRKHWLQLAADTANQPSTKKEETIITFAIAPDGTISAMALNDSTHNVALNKTAWSAIQATSYLPPPTGDLKLRVHFAVN